MLYCEGTQTNPKKELALTQCCCCIPLEINDCLPVYFHNDWAILTFHLSIFNVIVEVVFLVVYILLIVS